MANSDYYRLEYNEKQGKFEYNSFSKRKEKLFGWETIAMVICQADLEKFMEIVKEVYPQISSGQGDPFPKTEVIRKMYNEFIGISDL